MRCSCGWKMATHTAISKGNGAAYYYYVCKRRQERRQECKCTQRSVKAMEIEQVVWGLVSDLLVDPERIRSGMERLIEQERATHVGDPEREAEAWAERVLRPIVEGGMPPHTLINVNFPALPPEAVKGVRIAPQGRHDYGRLRIVARTDPRGYDYFWFGLAPMVETPGHMTDLEVVADGYIAVTPLHFDLTHAPSLERLSELYR